MSEFFNLFFILFIFSHFRNIICTLKDRDSELETETS